MGVAMPFSQFKGPLQLSEAMSEAFRRVCDVLRLNGDVEDPVTELEQIPIDFTHSLRA